MGRSLRATGPTSSSKPLVYSDCLPDTHKCPIWSSKGVFKARGANLIVKVAEVTEKDQGIEMLPSTWAL